MVLKIKIEMWKPAYDVAWIYYGGIKSLRVNKISSDRAAQLDWSANWLGEEQPDSPTPDEVNAIILHDDEKCIVCRTAYLLNDDGKTIERL